MKGNLQDFLIKIHNSLLVDKGSDAYRLDVANKITTTVSFKQGKVLKTLEGALSRSTNVEFKDINNTKDIFNKLKPNLKKELKKTFNEIRENFVRLKSLKNNNKRVLFLNGTEKKDRMTLRVLLVQEKGGKKDIFKEVHRQYDKALQKFYTNFITSLNISEEFTRHSTSTNKGKGGDTSMESAGTIFNLEHLKGKSNVEAFINDTIFNALEDCFDPNDDTTNIQEAINQLGIGKYIKIKKIVKTGELHVFLGDQSSNVRQGEKEQKRDLVQALTKAIKKLGPEKLEGSDSLSEGVRKKALKEILTKFQQSGAVIVKQESTKIKESSNKPTIKNVTSKYTKSSMGVRATSFRKKGTKQPPAQKGVSGSPLALLALMNKQLPDKVRSNMQVPALENQTGRFAQSVRLTDVIQTPQGFPSFGYTYRKDPYEVYETTSGSRFASSDRDPRKIIDKSIREVAAQYAMGRFYTRRE